MYYEYNDIKIFIDKINRGKSKNIIILPGWGECSNTFNNIINYFTNYNIYIINYPGFGKSPIPNKDLTIYDYEEIIYNFILDKNINNIYIISHSFGGRIASILIGKDKLRVSKLVLIDTAGLRNKKIIFKNIIYKIKKRLCINKNKLFNKYASIDYKDLNSVSYKTFINIVNENLKKYYKRIHIDTLIIWGMNDNITPIKDGERLNKLIKNSALIKYRGSHFTYLEYPDNINKVINAYFN